MARNLSSEEASRIGRLGALSMLAKNDVRVTSLKGREVFLARFEKEVDPDGVLDPEDRERRAGYAKRAYFIKLAQRSRKRQ